MLNGSGGESKLGHGPHEVGHDGGDEPGPAKEWIEVAVDGVEGTVASGEGDVSDGGQHDDAADHGEGLDPHRTEAGGATEEESACEGASSEGDGALEPTGTRELGVGEELLSSWGVGDGLNGSEFAVVLRLAHEEPVVGHNWP